MSKKKPPKASLRRVAFSGAFCVGKDYVAEKAGYEIVSIAEPMYRVCESLFGSCNKKREDHRRFLQQLGQLGWGCPTAVHDLQTAAIIFMMRTHGASLSGYWNVAWHEFGTRADFWIGIALDTIANTDLADKKVAITNARFKHEIDPLKKAGFEHYLVACTYEVRSSRNGGTISELVNQDVSEQYAKELIATMDPKKIIWNDPGPDVFGRKFLSVDRFVSLVKEETDE